MTVIIAVSVLGTLAGWYIKAAQGLLSPVLQAVQAVTLLGAPAFLPTGPMRAAAILRCPVFFMAGLYRGKNRYHVVFERVADFSATPAALRDAAVRSGIERYAAVLDVHCRGDPYNWFNVFDFWRTGQGARG